MACFLIVAFKSTLSFWLSVFIIGGKKGQFLKCSQGVFTSVSIISNTAVNILGHSPVTLGDWGILPHLVFEGCVAKVYSGYRLNQALSKIVAHVVFMQNKLQNTG